VPEWSNGDLRIRIDATSGQLAALRQTRPYAAGRLLATGRRDPVTVLVRGAHAAETEVTAASGDIVVLPAHVDPISALVVPAVASALAVWESLNLELGEAAVWTGGSPLSALIGRVALWRGACPAIELGPADPMAADTVNAEYARKITSVDWSDAEVAQARLTDAVADRPGFAAVDLSGRADVIDALLEVIPRWGRLLLAGPAGSPVTIDFYKNVHRKGIVLSSTILEPASIFETGNPRVPVHVSRALEVLRNQSTGAECRRLFAAHAAAVSLVG
jgi:hypothetical protein